MRFELAHELAHTDLRLAGQGACLLDLINAGPVRPQVVSSPGIAHSAATRAHSPPLSAHAPCAQVSHHCTSAPLPLHHCAVRASRWTYRMAAGRCSHGAAPQLPKNLPAAVPALQKLGICGSGLSVYSRNSTFCEPRCPAGYVGAYGLGESFELERTPYQCRAACADACPGSRPSTGCAPAAPRLNAWRVGA
jgi:hypothetical protein